MKNNIFFLPPLAVALLTLASCTKKADVEALEKGKTIYMSRCISCHNADPKKPGSIGPEIFGSSKDLLETKILSMKYPSGHRPKRDTRLMPVMPELKGDIEGLQKFLNN